MYYYAEHVRCRVKTVMIRSFRDRRTAEFAAGNRIKAFQSFERQVQKRLRILIDAERIEDLAALPSLPALEARSARRVVRGRCRRGRIAAVA